MRWFGPDVSRALIHEDDLAAVATLAPTTDGRAGAVYALTGPERLTQAARVAVLGEVLGGPLRIVDVGPENAASLFSAMVPAGAEALVRARLAILSEPERVTDDVQRLHGRPATGYAQWVRDHADAVGT